MAMMSVILESPRSDALIESAWFAMSGRSPNLARDATPALPGLEIDREYSAIPIPTVDEDAPEGFSFASLTAATTGEGVVSALPSVEVTDRFVYRGMIDDKDLPGVQEAALAAQVEVYADPPVSILRGGVSYPRRAMGSAADVRGLLGVPTLEDMGFDGHGVAVAIVDTGINLGHLRDRGVAASLDATVFWKPPTSAEPGHFPVGHGTMCAYDALVCAPRATLLDFPVLQSQRRGGSVMDGLLSDAILAYGVLLTELSKPLAQRAYRALVVSNSWGMYNPSWDFAPGRPGRYGDNPGHPFNRQVASLARAGADIIFAAGNCGSDCPDGRCRDDQGTVHTHVISGANSHPNVLSVAGVDVNEDRVCYSSQGPGMLNNDKPDISAYTHFLGSAASGRSAPDTGTSAACPVAAGAVASLRTRIGPNATPPSALRDAVRRNADRPDGGQGWSEDFGHGIIRPTRVAQDLGFS